MLDNTSVHDSKLFALLRVLKKKEVRELSLWLESPIHNTLQQVRDLYEGIRKYNRNFSRPLDKLTLLKYAGIEWSGTTDGKLLPQEEKALREVMHRLTVQIQDYILWKKTQEDELMLKRRMMDAFLERKLYKYLPKMMDKAKRELDSGVHRDNEHYEAAFQLAEMDFFLSIILHNRNTKAKEMQLLIDGLRQSFLSKLLKYYCAAVSRQKVLQVDYQYPFMDFVKQYLAVSEDKELPAIKVYYTLLLLMEDYKEEHYASLKNYLFTHLDLFSNVELRQFFNHMTNYCNWMVKQGRQQFVQEQHEIFEKGLELGCWSSGIYFSTHQFMHIVKNALKLGEIDWANNFVSHHKKELSPDIREHIANYALALMCFHNKQFSEAQGLLMQINFTEDFTYHLELRILLIKIYYETDNLSIADMDSHPLNYELEALRQNVSIRNKKMSESLRQSYNNFANVFKRILDRKKKLIIGQKLSAERVQKLQDELVNISPIVERDWLMEKVKLLKHPA